MRAIRVLIWTLGGAAIGVGFYFAALYLGFRDDQIGPSPLDGLMSTVFIFLTPTIYLIRFLLAPFHMHAIGHFHIPLIWAMTGLMFGVLREIRCLGAKSFASPLTVFLIFVAVFAVLLGANYLFPDAHMQATETTVMRVFAFAPHAILIGSLVEAVVRYVRMKRKTA
jgi:hypothetical protein